MAEELWGGETRRAIENFPVSGEPIPREVARWLGRIKAAAARVNAELDGELLEQLASPEPAGRQLLTDAADRLKLSARGYHRVLRVARTLAIARQSG